MPYEGSVRRRTVLATTAWTALVMVVLMLALGYGLDSVVGRNLESALDDRLTEAAALVAEASTPTAVDLSGVGGDVAVVDRAGRVVAGSLPEELDTQLESLAAAGRAGSSEVDEEYVLAYRPLDDGGPDGWGVAAAEPHAPYEQAERWALLVAGGLAILSVVGVAVVSAWTVGRALAPVAEMARTADEWGAHDLDRRFGLDEQATEIGTLGATLDHLLDRVATALRAEQRLTSEVAHELRNPLAAIQGTADLALARGDLTPPARAALEKVSAEAHRMAASIGVLLDVSRPGSQALDGTCSVAELLDALGLSDAERPELVPDLERVRLALPVAVAVRAVAPVLENARRHGGTGVTLRVHAAGPGVEVVVSDEGPGLGDRTPDEVFDPTRGGLGLPLARRVARAAGGDVRAERSAGGGHFVVTLPRRR